MMTFPRSALFTGLAFAAVLVAGCNKGPAAPETSTTTAQTEAATVKAPVGGWDEAVVQTADGGFQMGNPSAQAKLIEYGSRTCPHCGLFAKEAMPEIKQMVATGKLSYEFRDFAIHAPDIAAILLGQCNGAPTFFPILEGMMADQVNTLPKLEKLPDGFVASLQGKPANAQAKTWADYLGYKAFVGQRGVPEAKADACLSDSKALDAIGKHMQDGVSRFNISGTPTFVLNGDVIGTAEWAGLKPKLTAAMGG